MVLFNKSYEDVIYKDLKAEELKGIPVNFNHMYDTTIGKVVETFYNPQDNNIIEGIIEIFNEAWYEKYKNDIHAGSMEFTFSYDDGYDFDKEVNIPTVILPSAFSLLSRGYEPRIEETKNSITEVFSKDGKKHLKYSKPIDIEVIDMSETKVLSAIDEIKSMFSEIKSKFSTEQKIENEISEIKTELEEFSKELSIKEDELKEVKEKLSLVEQENIELKCKIEEFSKQTKELTNDIETVTKLKDELSKENETLKVELESLKSKFGVKFDNDDIEEPKTEIKGATFYALNK